MSAGFDATVEAFKAFGWRECDDCGALLTDETEYAACPGCGSGRNHLHDVEAELRLMGLDQPPSPLVFTRLGRWCDAGGGHWDCEPGDEANWQVECGDNKAEWVYVLREVEQ